MDADCCKLISEFSAAALRSPAPVVEPAEAVAAEFADVADDDGADDEDDKDHKDGDDDEEDDEVDCRFCPAVGICCAPLAMEEASWACMLCWSCAQ